MAETGAQSVRIENPYENLTGGRWLKGNLHAHTTRSDGSHDPQVVIDRYAELGHDFLMISDHDIYTSAQDHKQWDSKGLILIPGNEISRHGPHMLHVYADSHVQPSIPRQRVLNDVAKARGFVVVPHPNWQLFDHATISQMKEWTGYVGMEIYNGVIGRLDGSPYATNKWDMLLADGRRVWGFANDDSHDHAKGDSGLGWNVVYAKDATVEGVVEAMLAGRFYASTGVEITKIEVKDGVIRIEAPNARRIVALQQIGRRIAVADGSSIEVTVPEGAKYVRFECWGDGEKFAWTQPFHVTQ